MAMPSSYWCYSCNRFVRVWSQDSITCRDCNGGFIEEMRTPTRSSLSDSRRRRFPIAAAVGDDVSPVQDLASGLRRGGRRIRGHSSPFNPVIVLRGGQANTNASEGPYELFYDDGSGSGLRPLPEIVSDFLLGTGFDRLLEQLSHIEANGMGRMDNAPASKAAIEAMPTIEIAAEHVDTDLHCAVCKEPFELGSDAREMPCKHLYHPDCILPWLLLRNSCPICRHELPTDSQASAEANRGNNETNAVPNENENVGLTIWRLPGGGFAVGRFSGGRIGSERELPAVYTEMDGGFNSNGAPRRVSWGSRGSVSRGSGGLRRFFRRFFSCFAVAGSSTSR